MRPADLSVAQLRAMHRPATLRQPITMAQAKENAKEAMFRAEKARFDAVEANHKLEQQFEDDHHTPNTGPNAQPEPNPVPELAGDSPNEGAGKARVHLCITSVRKRTCDPDNLVPKWYIDCLRRCGAINDDTADDITLEMRQRKTAKGEEETTIIEITYP